MIGRRRLRQVVEVALGLAPATFLLLPLLFAGALGMTTAAATGGLMDWATAKIIGWVLAGVLGIASLWVVVLRDGAGLRLGGRLMLTVGLLLGLAAATKWIWVMWTRGHPYEFVTWAVWLSLLGGPILIASFRLAQLWRDG